MAKANNTIWIASRDEYLQRFMWTALASQRMTPLTVPGDASLRAALGGLGARGGGVSALILDMEWVISDKVEVSTITRAFGGRDGNPPVFLIAANSHRIPENASHWVRSLGAQAILPRLSEADEAALELAMGAISDRLGVGGRDPQQLKTQLRASGFRLDQGPASIIEELTSRPADTVARALSAGVEIADRPHGMKRYPQCFVGKSGVSWLAAEYGIDREAAVSVGRALVRLGCVHHVLKEHDFEDDHLFYRAVPAGRYERVELSALAKLLRQTGGLIADRTWRATSYPSCFVGREAVDVLASAYRLNRAEGTALVQLLVDLGAVRHVTGEHEFTDGMFYFRFVADELSFGTVRR